MAGTGTVLGPQGGERLKVRNAVAGGGEGEGGGRPGVRRRLGSRVCDVVWARESPRCVVQAGCKNLLSQETGGTLKGFDLSFVNLSNDSPDHVWAVHQVRTAIDLLQKVSVLQKTQKLPVTASSALSTQKSDVEQVCVLLAWAAAMTG